LTTSTGGLAFVITGGAAFDLAALVAGSKAAISLDSSPEQMVSTRAGPGPADR
jgi:hypothetical protein